LNTKADDSRIPKRLKPYFQYVNTSETDESDVFISEIHEHVKAVNQDPEWRGVLMTLREEMHIIYKDEFDALEAKATAQGMAKGMAKGMVEGKAELLANLVKDHILSIEEAKARLDDPEVLDKYLSD